jgi:hypothetical protein
MNVSIAERIADDSNNLYVVMALDIPMRISCTKNDWIIKCQLTNDVIMYRGNVCDGIKRLSRTIANRAFFILDRYNDNIVLYPESIRNVLEVYRNKFIVKKIQTKSN